MFAYKNPFSLNHFLTQLPLLIGFLFENTTDTEEFLRLHLEEKFSEIQSTSRSRGLYIPTAQITTFINNLSQSINTHIVEPYKARNATQTILIRYIESMLDKTLYDFSDAQEAWNIFKDLIHTLKILLEYRIISQANTFNHLLWSLVYRFSSQIEKEGASIPLATYAQIEQDLNDQQLLSLYTREKEPLTDPKIKILYKSLTIGKAKAMAYAKNILALPS